MPGPPSAVEALIAQHFPHLVEDVVHILEIRKAGAAVILPTLGSGPSRDSSGAQEVFSIRTHELTAAVGLSEPRITFLGTGTAIERRSSSWRACSRVWR